MCNLKTGIILLFLLPAAYVFSQDNKDEMMQRGSIPLELLRPRRDGESPRYPVDTVIGPLGRGRASEEAYRFARNIATALVAGNMNAPALSSANKVFLENCKTALNAVSPRLFRLGGGREEPDGSVSFLVRFAGREEGITGEMYIRSEVRHPPGEPARAQTGESADEQRQPGAGQTEAASEPEGSSASRSGDDPGLRETTAEGEIEAASAENVSPGDNSVTEEATATVPAATVSAAPPPVVRIWFFEDLILEEPRSREAENNETRHRYDFTPYERFF